MSLLLDTGHWLQTFTGKKFYFSRPNSGSINIIDIAHALSRIPRFYGHTDKFYSVAEHCILASKICDSVDESKSHIALLHDASEAYIGDIVSPLKNLMGKKIKKIERQTLIAIFKRFDIKDKCLPSIVEEIDLRLLQTERLAMFNKYLHWETTKDVKPYHDVDFRFLNPKQAETEYLKRFEMLMKLVG